ncbi:hypothetical protein LNJ06_09515 [Tenacibaculum finnmarkense genomovar ulcerans]|uniref:hypothetical protein n=1 Tax=Tenacibaculum finnmarkense TaxID=2781243 RepID=UPI001E3AB44E|nr:hypothetical protein [Tenacibaculum finnmarkense]MCD8430405.1 hypothetical protein [Tenacibaculum finnmarkense genomovar ulcerans]
MNLQEKINENTTLYYIEDAGTAYDAKTDTEVVTHYSLSLGFYDCHYHLNISRKDIEANYNYGCNLDGDSKLYDSFQSICEGELWELIKARCKDFDKYYADMVA